MIVRTGKKYRSHDFMSRLKDIRLELGLTQQGLADKIGVTRITMVYWETGRSFPRRVLLDELATALNVSADWLAGAE